MSDKESSEHEELLVPSDVAPPLQYPRRDESVLSSSGAVTFFMVL